MPRTWNDDGASAMKETTRARAPLPLEGMRVLDLCQVMAGPFCCMLLGDMGADVIKVEPPGKGDQTRGAMGFKLKGNDSLGFMNLNRNKRSIALDLKNPSGREVLYKLVKTADVVVENYRPGVTARLGIGYETLKEIKPDLIYASISGFGQTGPWSDRPGFDLMAQAMTGIVAITGHPGQPPVRAGVPVADLGCGLFALYAILSAYVGKTKTGVGQYIDASLFESALALTIWDTAQYWGTGERPEPIGTANRMSAPYQAVKAKDAYFVLGANNGRLWERLCNVIGRPDLISDSRFATIPDRLARIPELIAEIEKQLASRSADEWVNLMLEAGIPAAPILNLADALDSDHAKAREMVMDLEHPIEGSVRSLGFPVKFSGTPPMVRRSPPLLGEQSGEIMREIGIEDDGVESLRREGAFGGQ
jgi:crotonobetainyl-CoA:carnitine CoA-transferase CaiB-like acyl-CoA transferase